MISYKNVIAIFALSIVLFALMLVPTLSRAQSFEEGITLYEKGNFEEATEIFDTIDSPEGRLFSGKSYFGLGNYLTAKAYLSQINEDANKDIYLEAQYTLALNDFQLGLFGDALARLYKLQQHNVKTKVVTDGTQLYKDILDYLTLNQRKTAFQKAERPQIKYDLIRSAIGTVSLADARTLYAQLLHSKIDTTSPAMQELSEIISDSLNYKMEMAYGNRVRAPEGLVYDIGAALPSHHSPGAEYYEVARSLYFGYVLAAEDFNQRHSDKKAFIRYQNTAADMYSASHAMTNLAWNYHADAVLGPLFSDPARKMAELAEQYQIPLIAPLANSDTLNVDNPYVYQANPTFILHGRKMAEFAVNNLHMDTLAVLAEKNTLGEASAFAFRDKAERMGAKVAYFFVEDLKSKGYDLTEYTKYFTNDSAKIDSLNYHYLDGIYAPFTGQAASTLGELLLVDLEAKNSNIPVLGSQQWSNFDIPELQLENQPIYFSESYYINKKSERVKQFNKRFKQRFDTEPDRFAMIGYDVATYLLNTLNRVVNPAYLKNALKKQPKYKGLINNIYFGGTHINQEVKIFEFTKSGSIRPVLPEK